MEQGRRRNVAVTVCRHWTRPRPPRTHVRCEKHVFGQGVPDEVSTFADAHHGLLPAAKEASGRGQVSAGADARTAARLQPDVHGLRPHSRVRQHDQGQADGRRMPGQRGRVRRADRQHLRRRADDLPGDRRASGQDPGAQEAHLPVHQRHVHPQETAPASSRRRDSSSTFTWTAWKRRHDLAVERKGVFDEAVEGIKAAKEPVSWSARTRRSTRKPTCTRSPCCCYT